MSRLVVVSNRVPVPRGGKLAPGGLAVGLMSALQAGGGLWFGWDGKVGDLGAGSVAVHDHGPVRFATLSLCSKDYEEYYNGYANRVLWPLFHYRLNLIDYQRRYSDGYLRVNGLFAHKLQELLQPGDRIWVHDYHCIPVAQQLREAGLRQPLGFFLHIPFPPPDLLRALPEHETLLSMLCAYDLLGFQTEPDRRAFQSCLEQFFGARAHADGTISTADFRVRTGVFPISIDVDEVAATAAKGRASRQGRRLQDSLQGRALITGVDRLDYSKGLSGRFRAFQGLLKNYPDTHGRVVYLQVAQPSRSDVPEYKQVRRELNAIAGEITGSFAEYDWAPLIYLSRGFVRSTVLGFLGFSRVGLVTPLRDGMNLVAKEFVAAQDPENPGVLVLSRLAGAAEELDAAVLVNPYDIEDMTEQLARALSMAEGERRERWQAMMQALRRNDVHHWRERFIAALKAVGV